MNGLLRTGRALAWICLLLGLNGFAAEIAPDEVVRKTADEVIATIKADKDIQAGDRSKTYALIDSKVLPHFDFIRMTRLAMGRNWHQATPDQQKQMVDGFRDLLVRTYATSLSQYKNQVVQVKGTEGRPEDTDAIVHTAIIPSGGQTVPIDYSMEKTAEGWKVFDIKVDGVSLVTNYRSEFSDIVRRSGVDGLIKALDDKRKLAEKR